MAKPRGKPKTPAARRAAQRAAQRAAHAAQAQQAALAQRAAQAAQAAHAARAQQAAPAPAAPAPAAPAEKPSFLGRVGGGLGRTFGDAVKGTLGKELGSNFEREAFGTSGKTLGTIGAGGAIYGLGKLLFAAKDKYDEYTTPKPKKQLDQNEVKYREKVTKDVTQGYQNFDQRALDAFSNQQDEGWNFGLRSLKPETYKGMAVQAIKNNDPSALWNEVILAAKAKGKKVNATKPVYLPQQFTKGGKQFAYAIDPSPTNEGGKPRLIPIELGKGVNWGDDETK